MANMYPSKMASGGGGSGSFTTLWTNATPTSSLISQTIYTGTNLTKMSYIKFNFYKNTDNDSESSVIIRGSDFSNYTKVSSQTSSTAVGFVLTLTYRDGANYYTREIRRGTTGTGNLKVYDGIKYTSSGGVVENSYCILKSIEGMS